MKFILLSIILFAAPIAITFLICRSIESKHYTDIADDIAEEFDASQPTYQPLFTEEDMKRIKTKKGHVYKKTPIHTKKNKQ